MYLHSTIVCVLCMCTALIFASCVCAQCYCLSLRPVYWCTLPQITWEIVLSIDFTFCSESTEQNTARSTPNVSEWLRRKQRQHHSPPLVKLFEKGISKWTGAIFGILDVRLSLPEHTTYMHTHTHIIKSTTHIHHMNSALHTNTPYGGRWCCLGP